MNWRPWWAHVLGLSLSCGGLLGCGGAAPSPQPSSKHQDLQLLTIVVPDMAERLELM